MLFVAVIGASAVLALALRGEWRSSSSDVPEETAARRGANVARLGQAIAVLLQSHNAPSSAERQQALAVLVEQPEPPNRLATLLEAAASDPTPIERDPLWPQLVEGLASVWRGERVAVGLDLILVESRPRARLAVVASLARVAVERLDDLTVAERQKLAERFIDLHHQLPPRLKEDVESAMRKLSGDDIAVLLREQGMGPGEELAIQREQRMAAEELLRTETLAPLR